MSSRLTSITLPGAMWSGLADWGIKTPEEMIEFAREYSADLRRISDIIDAALDAEFSVITHTGVYIRRNIEVLQKGRTA